MTNYVLIRMLNSTYSLTHYGNLKIKWCSLGSQQLIDRDICQSHCKNKNGILFYGAQCMCRQL